MLDMDSVKIGFIGYGNMAGAASSGLMLSGAVSPDRIYACARNYDKLCTKTEAEGTHACRTSLEIVETCDIIFIGVKPYLVSDVMTPLKNSPEGKMALKSGNHPGQMKDAVCSPGGTTIVGVSALEKNGFRYAVIDAIDQIDNKIKGKL